MKIGIAVNCRIRSRKDILYYLMHCQVACYEKGICWYNRICLLRICYFKTELWNFSVLSEQYFMDLLAVDSTLDSIFRPFRNYLVLPTITTDKHCELRIPNKKSPTWFPPHSIWLHGLGTQLDGIAKTAMVEVGDSQVAGYFAEKGFSKRPFFRNGMSMQQVLLVIMMRALS